MKAFVHTLVAGFALGAAVAAPIAAQNPAKAETSCDPTANTKGDIAKAQFSMTRAIAVGDKGNPTRDLQEVLRLVDNGNDNPTARNYLRGEAYVLYLMQPNTPAVVQRSALGLTSNPTGTIDLFAAADSAFAIVEKASPECGPEIIRLRQQKPWQNAVNASLNALTANQFDSAETFAKRSLVLDSHAPYAYWVLGSVERNKKNWAAANAYWKQALAVASTDSTYTDVRIKTLYQIAAAASERAESMTGAAKRTAAREAIKPWQDYFAAATSDLMLADGIDNLSRMYIEAGDSASINAAYAPLFTDSAKYGENARVHAGVVASRAGRHADAIRLFSSALVLNPYSRDAINGLAASLISAHQSAKAIPVVDRLVAIEPGNPDNVGLYAFAYSDLVKTTKDKKLAKIYTDSLVYFHDRSEKAPLKIVVTDFTRGQKETVIAGTIENRGTVQKMVELSVDFLDVAGNIIGTEKVQVGPIALRSVQEFRVTTPKGGVFGYRYKLPTY